MGRFSSPDEFKGGIVDPFTGKDIETNTALPYADITDPQTLNKYAYVRNNPLRYVDPNGHDFWDYLSGVGNAFVSDNALGAGRASGGNDDFRLGQTVGDGVAVITGSLEALGGGGEAVITSPAAATGVGAVIPAAGAVVAAHGATTVAVAGGHLVGAAADTITERRAGDFKSSAREGAIRVNADANDGTNKCKHHVNTIKSELKMIASDYKMN